MFEKLIQGLQEISQQIQECLTESYRECPGNRHGYNQTILVKIRSKGVGCLVQDSFVSVNILLLDAVLYIWVGVLG